MEATKTPNTSLGSSERDILLRALDIVEGIVNTEVTERQNGVQSFFDGMLLTWLRSFRTLVARTEQSVGNMVDGHGSVKSALAQGEMVSYSNRLDETLNRMALPWELTGLQMCAAQGVFECYSWRGVPLFKTAYDLAIYPLLIYEQRPLTILELGTGSGGSSMFFADLLRTFGLAGHVYTIDKCDVQINDRSITHIQGDLEELGKVMSPGFLNHLPHPWLVVEDAHVHTLDLLRELSAFMRFGDYLAIEDSWSKRRELMQFDSECGDRFKVHTRYTDFFGRNSTSCQDSVFCCVR